MDLQKFIQNLPDLYHHWGSAQVTPKSHQFREALKQISAMTTPCVIQLLNWGVACLGSEEVYCEVGTYQGATLVGAMLGNLNCLAYAVDDFSELDPTGLNENYLLENLRQFNLQERVYFCRQDFEEFFGDLEELATTDRIGVYFYDGAHDYRSQLLGLMLARPFLADQALIVVGDGNWQTTKQAVWDFLATNPEAELVMDLGTPTPRYASFWNGLMLIAWQRQKQTPNSHELCRPNRQPCFLKAIYNLQMLERRYDQLREIYTEALVLHGDRAQLPLAERKYLDYLFWQDEDGEAWANLGRLYLETGRFGEAVDSLTRAVELLAERGDLYANLGFALEQLGHLQGAITAYTQALQMAPNLPDTYNLFGILLAKQGKISQAEAVYRRGIDTCPEHYGCYLNLGNLLVDQAQLEEAIANYRKALQLAPEQADIQHNLQLALDLQANPQQTWLDFGQRFYQQQNYSQALVCYAKLPQIASAHTYYQISKCHHYLGDVDQVIATLEAGLVAYPDDPQLHFTLVMYYQQTGQTKAGIAQAEIAAARLPEDYTFQLLSRLLLPIIYDTPGEMTEFYDRFSQGLEDLIANLDLSNSQKARQAFAGISRVGNFHLAHQPQNIKNLQIRYGQLVTKILAANYPDWMRPLAMPEIKTKIRIGYASAFMHSYSGTYWLLGWFKHHNRDQFEIYCYHTGTIVDDVTEQFRHLSHAFHQIPGNFEAVCQRILADQLHVLIFPEIGMDAQTIAMAALRLAPVQCTDWGHSVTSGLPNVDYYLSGELMEPDTGQDHYSETLVRLPHIGVAYPRPVLPALTKNRADWQLQDDDLLYLCCQAPFKYLPQYDYILAAIAQAVPRAKFIFFRRTKLLQPRLTRAFSQVGLTMENYCYFLEPPPRDEYLMLNCLCDVYLDTIGYTGGNTSLDAIACHLPVVTLPIELMRGRMSAAMLQRIGVTETIAQTEAEYIAIATRLGLDSQWRAGVKTHLAQNSQRLYDDPACVIALEEFFRQVVKG